MDEPETTELGQKIDFDNVAKMFKALKAKKKGEPESKGESESNGGYMVNMDYITAWVKLLVEKGSMTRDEARKLLGRTLDS